MFWVVLCRCCTADTPLEVVTSFPGYLELLPAANNIHLRLIPRHSEFRSCWRNRLFCKTTAAALHHTTFSARNQLYIDCQIYFNSSFTYRFLSREDMEHLRITHSQEGEGKLHKVSIRERISHFTWAWFECTMSTGALAIILARTPFRFTGLDTIGKIVFILDLVLFVIFCSLITFRFIMHPQALSTSLHHPHESFFFGMFLRHLQ